MGRKEVLEKLNETDVKQSEIVLRVKEDIILDAKSKYILPVFSDELIDDK